MKTQNALTCTNIAAPVRAPADSVTSPALMAAMLADKSGAPLPKATNVTDATAGRRCAAQVQEEGGRQCCPQCVGKVYCCCPVRPIGSALQCRWCKGIHCRGYKRDEVLLLQLNNKQVQR